MKERINGVDGMYEFDFETKIEFEVGDILLDLEEIIVESECRNQFSSVWGARRRRSAIDSSVPSPLPKEEREIDKRLQVKMHSAPLCFSPSECDEKSKHQLPKTSSKKRVLSPFPLFLLVTVYQCSKRPILHTRKDWLEIIDGLTQRKELLTKEVDVVRGYYNKLMTFNLALKDEINCYYLRKENPQLEINRGLKSIRMRIDQQQRLQYPVSVFPRQPPPYPHGRILSSGSGSGLGMMNPRGIPDLNVVCAAEETFGMMVDSTRKKIMAAQARKRRMITINSKKISLVDKKTII